MTNSQINAIAMLKEQIIKGDSRGDIDGVEYKHFNATEFVGEAWVVLHAVTGHVGDEDTLASVLYRRSHVYWIGPRGRILSLLEQEMDRPEIVSLPVALKEPYRKRTGQPGARQQPSGQA